MKDKAKPVKLEKLVSFNQNILPNDLKTFNSNDLAKYLRNKIQFNVNDLYNKTNINGNEAKKNTTNQYTMSNEEKIIEMRRNKFEEFNKLVIQNKKVIYNQTNIKEIGQTEEFSINNENKNLMEMNNIPQKQYLF